MVRFYLKQHNVIIESHTCRSIGATVVEMLTGETPYTNENFDNRLAIVYQVGSCSIDPLTSMKKGGKVDVGAECFLINCFKRYYLTQNNIQ